VTKMASGGVLRRPVEAGFCTGRLGARLGWPAMKKIRVRQLHHVQGTEMAKASVTARKKMEKEGGCRSL
jgi:hypothetical protein